MIGRVVISDPAPRPLHGEARLSHLYNKQNQRDYIDGKINIYTVENGKFLIREKLYFIPNI